MKAPYSSHITQDTDIATVGIATAAIIMGITDIDIAMGIATGIITGTLAIAIAIAIAIVILIDTDIAAVDMCAIDTAVVFTDVILEAGARALDTIGMPPSALKGLQRALN